MSNSQLHQTTPTRFVETAGKRFGYRRFGKEGGPPIVFFQHFRGTMDNWDPILTNRLAEIRPVVLFDNVGIGRSSGTPPTTIAGMARDAIGFIKTLDAPPVCLFGFSTGGFVTQEVAIQAPELFEKMVLAGTGPQGGERMAQYSPRVVDIVTSESLTYEERCLALFFGPSARSQAAGRAWLARVASRGSDREPPVTDAAGAAQLLAIQAWGRRDGDRSYLRRITQPVLVANGNDDIMVPTVNSFILQQELPDARLIVYPDSGHGALFQYSNVFAEEVVRLLA